MILRNEHKAVFNKQVLDEYIDKEVAYFMDLYEYELDTTEDKLRKSIELWIAQAKRYGITDEEVVERYLEQCITYEEMRADPKSWQVHNILAAIGASEDVKLDLLEDYFVDVQSKFIK